jgi:hypothetical protein
VQLALNAGVLSTSGPSFCFSGKSLKYPYNKRQGEAYRRCKRSAERTIFLCNKTNQMNQFHKFILLWKSTCFGQFVCPSSGVYSLFTQQWYMSYSFADSFRAGPGLNCVPSWSCSKAVWHTPLLSVQWINCWWWTDELSETCRVSCQNKFAKLVHLVGFIIKKFVTMHGHMNVKK